MFLIATLQDTICGDMVTEINSLAGGSAILRFLTGSIPVDADATQTGTPVVENPCSATVCSHSGTLTITFGSISNANAINAGTITYCRLVDGSGNAVMQFTADDTSGEILFDNATFLVGETCIVSSLVITVAFA